VSDTAPETTITVEDIKHKALKIRDLAESEARSLVEDQGAKLVAVAVVGVLVAVSLAYYLGTRRRY
jgi:hypothetical protein